MKTHALIRAASSALLATAFFVTSASAQNAKDPFDETVRVADHLEPAGAVPRAAPALATTIARAADPLPS